ncbi:FmdB family zinc ribbon protein [Coxiella-like endosymbiont of Rhipicephalus sanguineus]|nr:zinc ribbon domain-containing protein [Coxiella-like endosymbiont of Rhipicephalus sanguineus]
MPIYEYQCQNCAKWTEILQKITNFFVTKCPACHE